jgi:hypothetical protein
MKKILIAASLAVMAISACKKDPETISTVQTVSRPTISFSGGQFYSINTGGALPTVQASSYDSTLRESYPVTIVGTESLDNTTPGLYIVSATAKNKFGFITNENVYIAVTNIPASVNISGKYRRVDVATGGISNVTQLARGLYQLDNLGGVDRAVRPDLLFPVLFVQSNDSTLLIPRQATAVGTVAVRDSLLRPDRAIFRTLPSDTNYKYAITSPSSVFGGALRTFRKQP